MAGENVVTALRERVREQQNARRRRNPTLLKLQWLSERVRRADRIKREIAAGTYCIDTTAVARALLNLDTKD